MREILFRGKRVDNGEWVEGYFTKWKHFNGKGYVDNYAITPPDESPILVTPATIGQFTGLYDKDGTLIFEGDIVEFVGGTTNFLRSNTHHSGHMKGTLLIVKHLKTGYTLCLPNLPKFDYQTPNITSHIDNYTFWNHQKSLKVVGNIHDNRELLNS